MNLSLPGVDMGVPQGGALDYWPTPPDLAERVVAWCGDLRGKAVLEPSAGGGALVRPLLAARADEVCAIEVDPSHHDALRAAGHIARDYQDYSIHECDALTWGGPVASFDLCVMNSPFANGMDCAFLERSMDWAHKTVAILRTHALHGKERFERVWSKAHVYSIAFLVGRPSFGGGTPQHEFCVVKFRRAAKEHVSPQHIEWWTL